jgi:curved DNA-binding protein CbpA
MDSDMSGSGMGDSESEYIYVDQHGNPVGCQGGRLRSPPPGKEVNNTGYYTLMGLERNCSVDEIKKAYKRQALKWHPDKNPDNKAVSEEMFKKVSDAYQILNDPEKRALYDKYGEVFYTHARAHTQAAFNENTGRRKCKPLVSYPPPPLFRAHRLHFRMGRKRSQTRAMVEGLAFFKMPMRYSNHFSAAAAARIFSKWGATVFFCVRLDSFWWSLSVFPL